MESAGPSDYYIRRAVHRALTWNPDATLDQVLATCEADLGERVDRDEVITAYERDPNRTTKVTGHEVERAEILRSRWARILMGLAAIFVGLSLFAGPQGAATALYCGIIFAGWALPVVGSFAAAAALLVVAWCVGWVLGEVIIAARGRGAQ